MRSNLVLIGAMLSLLALAACKVTDPDEKNAQQVRVTQAVGDSLVVFAGRVSGQGGDWVQVTSCDGSQARTFYGTFLVEHVGVCQ